MKATGIVRRIDELGRVVIPKEIRSTLRLKSGDPLEIFTDRDELMLKKYSPIASLEKFSSGTAKGQRTFDKKALSEKMEKVLRERKSYIANLSEGGDVVPITDDEGESVTAQIIVPIVCNGDCLGAVALVSTEQGARIEGSACKLAQLSATILANQFE